MAAGRKVLCRGLCEVCLAAAVLGMTVFTAGFGDGYSVMEARAEEDTYLEEEPEEENIEDAPEDDPDDNPDDGQDDPDDAPEDGTDDETDDGQDDEDSENVSIDWLLSYDANDPAGYTQDGIPIYLNDESDDDIQVSFTVDESYEDYSISIRIYEADEEGGTDVLTAVYPAGNEEVQELEVGKYIDGEAGSCLYSFGFDGSGEQAAGIYYVVISYSCVTDGFIYSDSYAADSFVIDHAAPEQLVCTYTADDAVNYIPFGWLFSKTTVSVSAEAGDSISGLRYIRVTITSDDGVEEVREVEMEPCSAGVYETDISVDGADFKGTVLVEAVDWSGNTTSETRSCAAETEEMHESEGSVEIVTKTKASGSYDGVDYYNSDIELELLINDSFSGIGSYTYSAGEGVSESFSFADEAGYDLSAEAENTVTYEFSKAVTIDASSNDQNGAAVWVQYTDNAGYTGYTEEIYNIDTTKPVITVEYDSDITDGGYFNHTVTATVIITERNFAESLADIEVTGLDGAAAYVGGWSSSGSGDGTVHVCTVVFDEDGEYSFTVSCTDMAGNSSSYGRTDSFTIDQTAPVLTVDWDDAAARNGYYYAEARTASITIDERNFDPSLVEVAVTSDGDGGASEVLWEDEGSIHTCRLSFEDEATYSISISGMDLAENELEAYTSGGFVIDCTAPELEILEVEDYSANNAAVEPEVRCYDANLDAGTAQVTLTGYRNGEVDVSGSWKQGTSLMRFIMEDFDYTEENDDMYTLEAVVYDLAGNCSEASVTFSVNRFGSVYTFDDDTDALVGGDGRYYTNAEQTIVVTETNVDTLEFVSITLNHDGQIRQLEEGVDFTVAESGTRYSWKQYTYTVGSANFTRDGTYILTFYSQDRASNVSDNASRGKAVEFAVDKTSPQILISGIEDGESYSGSSREITVSVTDNLLVEQVGIELGGETYAYTSAEVEEDGGLLILEAESSSETQAFRVWAGDAAGNTADTGELVFTLSSPVAAVVDAVTDAVSDVFPVFAAGQEDGNGRVFMAAGAAAVLGTAGVLTAAAYIKKHRGS